MEMTLRRGATFKRKDKVYLHDRDGKTWIGNAKKREPYLNPDENCRKCGGTGRLQNLATEKDEPCTCNKIVLDVTEAEYVKKPGIWEMGKEAIKKRQLERIAAERKWWKDRGQEMPDEMVKAITGSPADKQVLAPGEETKSKRGPGRPRKIEIK